MAVKEAPLFVTIRWGIPYFICIETPERQMICYRSHSYIPDYGGFNDWYDNDYRDDSTLREPPCQSCSLREYRQQVCMQECGYYSAWKGILVEEIEPEES